MYHQGYQNPGLTTWGPYTNGYMSTQIVPQHNQMYHNPNEIHYNSNQIQNNGMQMQYYSNQWLYNTNRMNYNTNQTNYNTNQMYYNTKQMFYNACQMEITSNTNWGNYRVPTNYHCAQVIQQQQIPQMNVMQPMPQIATVNFQSFAIQEPPVKKRCVTIEEFMQNRVKQQPELSQLQHVTTPQIATINALQNNSNFNKSSNTSPFNAGFQFNGVQKAFDVTNSDSSGISSGGLNCQEPVAAKAPVVQANNSGSSSSGQATAVLNQNFGEGFENELLRIAIQFGPQLRLRKYTFQVDNMLREDFALDNYDSPDPVVRVSRFKFNWIFQDKPQMCRKFKPTDQGKSSNETSEAEKNPTMFTARQKSRIKTAISDIEHFITKQTTREKMFLISKYRALHKALKAAVQSAAQESD